MDQKAIFSLCKSLGCCDACGLRYLGLRNPKTYENSKEFSLKFKDGQEPENKSPPLDQNSTNSTEVTEHSNSNGDSQPNKKHKSNPCVSCLGLLQEDVWSECNQKVKEVLDKKKYECSTFACALSAPIVTILREKVVSLKIRDACKDYEPNVLTPLKEAWKWSFGSQLAAFLSMTLDAGNVAPLLVTLNMEYPDDVQELEVLKTLSPDLFESRSQQRRRFTVEFTRRSVEQALDGATLLALRNVGWGDVPEVGGRVACVSVATAHAPLYLGGRYIKLSRELPQTPWLVGGRRMMPSSVQEIIFEPLAKGYDMCPADAEHRLKFMSAGREDVDVRCLGDGRPFAVEVTDPRRELKPEELQSICDKISKSGQVVVKKLVSVTKEDLSELKKGEETKCKTYEALCIKLSHAKCEKDELNGAGDAPITVTPEDIHRLNTYRNTRDDNPARISILQRTPIRVLHRRPLLVRERLIYEVEAKAVPDYPQLLSLRLLTSAGAYVKEAVHGEFGRTRPALGDALGAKLDLLALDVAAVHLDWPR